MDKKIWLRVQKQINQSSKLNNNISNRQVNCFFNDYISFLHCLEWLEMTYHAFFFLLGCVKVLSLFWNIHLWQTEDTWFLIFTKLTWWLLALPKSAAYLAINIILQQCECRMSLIEKLNVQRSFRIFFFSVHIYSHMKLNRQLEGVGFLLSPLHRFQGSNTKVSWQACMTTTNMFWANLSAPKYLHRNPGEILEHREPDTIEEKLRNCLHIFENLPKDINILYVQR